MATQAAPFRQNGAKIGAKALIISALVLILYLEVFISRAANISARSVLDALVILLAGAIALGAFLSQRVRVIHLLLLFNIAIFTAFSMFGGLNPDLTTSILSAIIFSKFIIVFFLVGEFEMKDLKLPMTLLAGLHIIGCLANFAAPEFFTTLLPQVSYQIDTSRLMGFSLNANRSAAVSTILFLYFQFVDRNRLLVAIFLALIVLSGSRSLTMIAGLIAGYMFLISRTSISKKLAASILAGGAAITVILTVLSLTETLDVIENTIYGDLRYIRAAMLKGGYFLANLYFPLGAGGGEFGSSLSAGSEAYRMVGIGHWSSVIDMWGVYDSGIGAILGEYGWLGLAVFVVVVFLLFKTAARMHVPLHTAVFLLLMVILMSMVRTVASDFFFSFFFLFTYALVLAQHKKGQQQKAERQNAKRQMAQPYRSRTG